MSLLNTLGLQPHSRLNNEQADQFSKPLQHKVSRGEFAESELMLMRASDQNRERMLYGFGASPNAVPMAATWAAQYPDSAWANILLGASLIVSGWKLRGDSYEDDVEEDAWTPFLNGLSGAEDPLYRAAELEPRLAEPYAWLIHAGLGQGAAKEDQYHRFVEATTRSPLHWPTHYKYLNVVCEKWGGSHDEMFAFARARSKVAPAGHMVHCLIPAAFNEWGLALATQLGVDAALERMRQTEFAREVASALYAWVAGNSANLAERLQAVEGGFSSYGLNQFGLALSACGAAREARPVLAALNGEIESVPWAWLAQGARERANPAFVYDRACKVHGVSLA